MYGTVVVVLVVVVVVVEFGFEWVDGWAGGMG